MSCSDAILYWPGVVFCVWLLWLLVNFLETMWQLLYDLGQSGWLFKYLKTLIKSIDHFNTTLFC